MDKFVTKDHFDGLNGTVIEIKETISKLEIDISSLKEIISS